MSDDPTPPETPSPDLPWPESTPPSAVLVDDAPTEPVGPPPWPTGAPGTSSAPPSTPQPPREQSSRPGKGRQFLVGALVGALIGGATAAGVSAAMDDNGGGNTVVVRSAQSGGRNTSTITQAKDVQGILAKVEPAVVAIAARSGQGAGAGTGFVIASDGVIVTNNHVVDNATRIDVSFNDGTTRRAELLGSSLDNDLAVLKVDATDLPTAKLGSSDALQVGDEVIAIGNALDLGESLSVTRGIISAKGRSIDEESGAVIYDALQTDAAINPGNSGGPLVNANGEVVGINTAIADPSEAQNVGFAISIDAAKPIIEDLRNGRAVRVAFLGVGTDEITSDMADQMNLDSDAGVVVIQVSQGSAAADAGVERGDVILAVNGTAVETPDDLGAVIRGLNPGDEVELRVERDGSQQTLTATLGTRPSSDNG